ncbi:MAG: glycosidase, partial [Candidatus Eisenbacteria bacterium]|nr:glycosidase [Candidatus Eisenbacteria bacterium]
LVDALSKVRLSGLRLELETYSTGGERIEAPDSDHPGEESPAFRGFDHMESYYADFTAEPAPNVQARLSLNVLGNVPQNPIDEIFYENRGRTKSLDVDGDDVDLGALERLSVYQAEFSWEDRWFQLDGFYRTGHLHWQYEGDFFGLYRDAFYGENIDTYNGRAPLGVEIDGKRSLAGLSIAYGPQLWWGANPSVYLKYRRSFGRVTATAMYVDEFADQNSVTSSIAVPRPPTHTATLTLETTRGPLGLQLGGIWGGETKIGEDFQVAVADEDGTPVQQDHVRSSDTFGVKAKLTYQKGRWNTYTQAAYMGIVAEGGPTAIPTFTGWSLKDTGSGNQSNIMGGVALTLGRFQVGPNVLYQKPLVGPVDPDLGDPAKPRNILEDPFAVRGSRETFGAELLITYDPTPATWMWDWDNDVREDAGLAASLGLVYRDLRTTMDAAIGILEDGTTPFAFPAATPPRELWELRSRVVARPTPTARLVGQLYAGTGEPNGDDPRLVHYYGATARVTGRALAFAAYAKLNEWGPYDYHRDFNYTYPIQLMGDVSYSLGTPAWFDLPQTRFGVRGTWRSLDRDSPRYCPVMTTDGTGSSVCNPNAPGDDGTEWEIRTYFHIGI